MPRFRYSIIDHGVNPTATQLGCCWEVTRGQWHEDRQACIDELYGPGGDDRGDRWVMSSFRHTIYLEEEAPAGEHGARTLFSSLVRDGLVVDPRDRDNRR